MSTDFQNGLTFIPGLTLCRDIYQSVWYNPCFKNLNFTVNTACLKHLDSQTDW